MARLSKGEQEFVSGFDDIDAQPAAGAIRPNGTLHELDARGIASPLHVLRAHRALRALPPGQVLRVRTDSARTIPEFQALAKYVVGYELLAQEQDGEEVIHVLRRKR